MSLILNGIFQQARRAKLQIFPLGPHGGATMQYDTITNLPKKGLNTPL